jgi:hypothetical protein
VVIDRLRTQQMSLVGKGRLRLSKGCQRVIADFGDTKQSLYPLAEPAHLALLDELAAQMPERTEITPTYPSEPAPEEESLLSELSTQSDGDSFHSKTTDLSAAMPRQE